VPTQTTRFRVCNTRGEVRAIHVRQDMDEGIKRIWWEGPDGSTGLPDGIGVTDLPLFGSELVKTIPITKSIVVCEGEKAALALRTGGIPALATVTGAATAPTPKALKPVALGAKFILWPDNDPAGLKHMKLLAQNLFLAGAVGVQIIQYDPTAEDAVWPKGFDAADVVTPETARTVLAWLVEDWAKKARRTTPRTTKDTTSEPTDTITVTKQRDKGSVTSALSDTFGLDAVPGKSVRCPMHDDRAASLSVLADDLRVICHADCLWSSPGVTASQIREQGKATS
jgi:hypothetical protein